MWKIVLRLLVVVFLFQFGFKIPPKNLFATSKHSAPQKGLSPNGNSALSHSGYPPTALHYPLPIPYFCSRARLPPPILNASGMPLVSTLPCGATKTSTILYPTNTLLEVVDLWGIVVIAE